MYDGVPTDPPWGPWRLTGRPTYPPPLSPPSRPPKLFAPGWGAEFEQPPPPPRLLLQVPDTYPWGGGGQRVGRWVKGLFQWLLGGMDPHPPFLCWVCEP